MENGLILVGTEKSLNIGDYIQAVAAEQFFEHIDVYVERERLDEYSGEPVKLIMNGWFMHEPTHWPPVPAICPLFVAFHVNSLVKEFMLSSQGVDYLKKHEPIGCRDEDTESLLRSKGVNAYFSACLTLTLGYKYKSSERNGKCYFVDPFFILRKNQKKQIIRNFLQLPFYYKKIKQLKVKMGRNGSIQELLSLVSFYREYKKIFSEELLMSAEYVKHESENFHKLYPTDEAKLDYARNLVKMYASASMVITSRIHCALPCLGLETPVIYIENTQQEETSSCRLKGLRELFNVVVWDKDRLRANFPIQGKISFDYKLKNKEDYKKYASDLITRCLTFAND